MSALQQVFEQFVEDVDPDLFGELLRSWAFVGDGYGCYSTFEVRKELRKIVLNNDCKKDYGWEINEYTV